MNIFKNKKIIFFLFFLIIIGIAFYYFHSSKNENEFKSNEFGKVEKKDLIQRVTIAGTITPNKKTFILAPYNGYIKKIFVKIGDHVNQGDPLVSVVQTLQSNENSFPLRSPLSGTIVHINKAEGEYVKENDDNGFIIRIDDLSKVYVFANVPEIDRIKIKVNQKAIIKASAILNKEYEGNIKEISLAAKSNQNGWNEVVEYPVKIEITNKDDVIKSGMSVIADIVTEKKENILILRHEFIQRENEKYFVILKNGKKRDIKVGIQNEEGFEIVDGLKEGDQVSQVDFTKLNQG